MRAGSLLLLTLAILPFRAGAQSEVGIILNAIVQSLQAAEAIRRSAENSQQFPNPPGQPAGDPIWDYEESSLVPIAVLRKGPYRNISGQMVLSARQTPQGQVELIFYRADGSVSRREFVRFDRRDGRRIDQDEKGNANTVCSNLMNSAHFRMENFTFATLPHFAALGLHGMEQV